MIREKISKAQVGPQSIEAPFSLEAEERKAPGRSSSPTTPELLAKDRLQGRKNPGNLHEILRKERKRLSLVDPGEAPKREKERGKGPSLPPSEAPERKREKIVEIPRPEETPGEAELLPGLLHCPSTDGSRRPLLRQSIANQTCEARQATGYHKCSFCVHSKPRALMDCHLPPLENSPSHLAESRM